MLDDLIRHPGAKPGSMLKLKMDAGSRSSMTAWLDDLIRHPGAKPELALE
jgi:hypothetical protein